MSAAAYGGEKVIIPAKSHGGYYVGDIGAAGYEKRPLVYHCVIQLAGLVVLLIISLNQFASQGCFEFPYDCIVEHGFLLFNSGRNPPFNK
jgi:hypothetical protein